MDTWQRGNELIDGNLHDSGGIDGNKGDSE